MKSIHSHQDEGLASLGTSLASIRDRVNSVGQEFSRGLRDQTAPKLALLLGSLGTLSAGTSALQASETNSAQADNGQTTSIRLAQAGTATPRHIMTEQEKRQRVEETPLAPEGTTIPATLAEVIKPVRLSTFKKSPDRDYKLQEFYKEYSFTPDSIGRKTLSGLMQTRNLQPSGFIYLLNDNNLWEGTGVAGDEQYIVSLTIFNRTKNVPIEGTIVKNKMGDCEGFLIKTGSWSDIQDDVISIRMLYVKSDVNPDRAERHAFALKNQVRAVNTALGEEQVELPGHFTMEMPRNLRPSDIYYDKEFFDVATKEGLILTDEERANKSQHEIIMEVADRFAKKIKVGDFHGESPHKEWTRVILGEGGVCGSLSVAFSYCLYFNKLPYRYSYGNKGGDGTAHMWVSTYDSETQNTYTFDWTHGGASGKENLRRTADSCLTCQSRGDLVSFQFEDGTCRPADVGIPMEAVYKNERGKIFLVPYDTGFLWVFDVK